MRIVDARSLDGADFAAALQLQQRVDRERDPELPVTCADELRAVFADDGTDHARHQRVVAFDGAAAAAIGHLELSVDPANSNLAGVEITPASNDTCALVVRELLRRARRDGRSSVIAWGDHNPAADRFWTSLGAELRYTEQESSLAMDAVDAAVMADWIEAAPDDLELVRWADRCPEELIDAQVATANAMNDAPLDDLDIADTVIDAAMVRADIEAWTARGLDFRVVKGRHRRRRGGRHHRGARQPLPAGGVVAVVDGGAGAAPGTGHRPLAQGRDVEAAAQPSSPR